MNIKLEGKRVIIGNVVVDCVNEFVANNFVLDAITKIENEKQALEIERKEFFSTTIEDMDLSVRSYSCLKRSGINYLHELATMTHSELMKVRNLGRYSIEEITEKLKNNYEIILIED